MIRVDDQKLLEEFRALKKAARGSNRPRRRRNESVRDFIFRINEFRCRYTNRVFHKKKLSLVTLHPDQPHLPKWKNLGVACTEFALLKNGMDEDDFLLFLKERKRSIRREAFKNSKVIKEHLLHAYQHRCIYCEAEYGYTPPERILTADHKIPIGLGGTNDLGRNFKNIASSCKEHNFEKGNRTAVEYLEIIRHRKMHIPRYTSTFEVEISL